CRERDARRKSMWVISLTARHLRATKLPAEIPPALRVAGAAESLCRSFALPAAGMSGCHHDLPPATADHAVKFSARVDYVSFSSAGIPKRQIARNRRQRNFMGIVQSHYFGFERLESPGHELHYPPAKFAALNGHVHFYRGGVAQISMHCRIKLHGRMILFFHRCEAMVAGNRVEPGRDARIAAK